MVCAEIGCRVFWAICLVPNYCCHKVPFPENLIHEHAEVEHFIVIYGNEDCAILGEQVPGEGKPLVHELDPEGMSPCVVLVHEAIIVNEVTVAGVVGRINGDAFDLTRVGYGEGAEAIEVVPFENQVFAQALFWGEEFGNEIQSDKVGVECAVMFDGIPFPDQPEAPPVAGLQELDKLFLGQVAVVLSGHRKL